MKRLICLAFLLSARTAYGQDQRLLLTLSPLSMADPYDGFSFRPGAEVRITKAVYLVFEGGWYTGFQYLGSGGETGQRGYLLKPSIAWRFQQARLTRRFVQNSFFALEYEYKFKKYQILDSIQPPSPPVVPMYAYELPVTRFISCVTVKYVADIFDRKGFFLEWFAGIGVRNVLSRTTASPGIYNNIVYDNDYPNTDNGLQSRIGLYLAPNLTAGIKVGFGVL